MEKVSETSSALRPLLILLPWFNLSRFPFSKKTLIARQVVLSACFSYLGIWIIRNILMCLLGQAERQMEQHNMAIYISYILTGSLGLVASWCGTLYVPKKLKMVIETCDQLQQDPLFAIPFDNLRKVLRISLVFLSIIAVIYEAGIIVFSPFVNQYTICAMSPEKEGSALFPIDGIGFILSAFLWVVQKMLLYLLVYLLCSVVKEMFLKCDEEFKKMLQSPPTHVKIQRVRKRYFEICELMYKVDKLLLPFIFMEITVSFVNICFFLHSIIFGHLGFEVTVFSVTLFVIYFGEILFLLYQGCRVCKSTKACLETSKNLDPTKMNEISICTLTLFIENMENTDAGLTFLRLFLLDKAAILTILGSLISYVIVILQLNPN